MFTCVCTVPPWEVLRLSYHRVRYFPHTHRHAPVPPRVPSEFCRHAPDSLPVYGSTDYKLPLQNLPLPLQSAVFNPLPRGEKITQADHAKSWLRGAPSTAAPLLAAVIPGITSMIQSSYNFPISSIRMPSRKFRHPRCRSMPLFAFSCLLETHLAAFPLLPHRCRQ